MRTCSACSAEKPSEEFYRNGKGYRSRCKPCYNAATGSRVSDWRRQAKLKLVVAHGNTCIDCGLTGPPFLFDFDHRDPATKSFNVTHPVIKSYARMAEEASKCDLVCANCHRMRTHVQRCQGCEHCTK